MLKTRIMCGLLIAEKWLELKLVAIQDVSTVKHRTVQCMIHVILACWFECMLKTRIMCGLLIAEQWLELKLVAVQDFFNGET